MNTHKTRSTKRVSLKVGSDYLNLSKRFRLYPLRSNADLKKAGEVLDELIGRNLSSVERGYMEALARFVRHFEAETIRTKFKKLSPIELLKHLMRENKMNTSDLGYILGSRGLASEALNGKRGLSMALIAKLARRFAISPVALLDTES